LKILVDADSSPADVRNLIRRAAARTRNTAIFAANRIIPDILKNENEYTKMLVCPPEDSSVDNCLDLLAKPGDIAITRDIPLAQRFLDRGAAVLDDRGRIFTKENIRERLSLRDFTVGLAESGYEFERSQVYGKRELKCFADSLDTLLSRLNK
jgi:uncharacterized protein YaiI (UPF0178 family)